MTTRREKRGRIKVACASLVGIDPESGEARELPMFVEPNFPQGIPDEDENISGFFGIPGVGCTVEIEVTVSSDTDQSIDQASLNQLDPKWVACLINQGDTLSPDFKKNYPDRMGWRSKTGLFLIFDDKDGEIILNHSDKKTQVIISEGAVAINAAKVKIVSGEVLVGDGADSPFVRHTEWLAWAAAHTHLSAPPMSPTGPPVPPPPPTIASKKAKVK